MYSDFDWNHAPLSSYAAPVGAGVVYLIIVATLPKFVPAGGFKGLKPIFIFHNFFLSAWSLLMFLGCLWEMGMRMHVENDVQWAYCEKPIDGKAQGPLYFWSYMFYISKYYEMVDTVLALLKGSSPPHFALHVYHHALVPVIIWNWLEYRQTLQHPGLLFNAFVHVVMYAYYGLKLLGIPTPWKSWVTRLQIVQFVTSLALLCVTLKELKGDVLGEGCAGMRCLWVNIVFNMTLLWQFVGVLFSGPRPPRKEKKNGHDKKGN
mmetsp:Transcript_34285/g.87237  ORF Transcript_34285/g.87237 Transcript_34285/m.87237 type:complete len:262 (+) Transcript_34285:109-894(+)